MLRSVCKINRQILKSRFCYSTTNQIKTTKRFGNHLEKIKSDLSHRLNPLASAILKMQTEAEEIQTFSQELKEDKDLQLIAEKDIFKLNLQIEQLTNEMIEELVLDNNPMLNKCDEIMFELNAGVGGQEAMLFTQELYDLYLNYAHFKGWEVSTIQLDRTELGGLRHGTLLINDSRAYKRLVQESGVHRVQRVPKTEKSGRIHTSTSSVSILPTPLLLEIEIPPSDLKIETKRASGAGGQHVNTTESAVRMTHIPTGLSVDCQTERSQIQNRASALKILKNKLYKNQLELSDRLNRDKKKSQIGMSERSDKIRTFNFLQDRLTDHRVGVSCFNLKNIFTDSVSFDNYLDEVQSKLYLLEVDNLS